MRFRKNLTTGRVTDLSDTSPARYKAEGVEISKGMSELERHLIESKTWTGRLLESIKSHVKPTRRYADTVEELDNEEIVPVTEWNENLSEYDDEAQEFVKNFAEQTEAYNALVKQAVELNLFKQ